MRILLISDKFCLRGGAYIAVSRLAKLLVSSGHQVAVFYSHVESPEERLNGSLTGKITLFPIRWTPSSWRIYLGDRRIGQYLADAITAWRPDLIHIANFQAILSPEVIAEANKYNLPLVFHACDHKLFCMNGYAFLDPPGESCERCIGGKYIYGLWHKCAGPRGSWLAYVGRVKYHRIWNVIDAFAVPCATTEKALDRYGVPARRHVRMWYPIPENEFPPSHTHDGSVVFYSSSYTKLKGLNLLVEACRHIPSVNVHAYLLPGSMNVEQRKTEIEAHAPSNVRIFAHLDWQTGLNGIVASARAVVIPSLWPTVGEGALFQAMMMQKAIIASNCGAHKEILKHEETALLFDPGDVDGFAYCLERASKDEELCRYLGKQARKWAFEHVGDLQYYNKLVSLYDLAVKERGARSLNG